MKKFFKFRTYDSVAIVILSGVVFIVFGNIALGNRLSLSSTTEFCIVVAGLLTAVGEVLIGITKFSSSTKKIALFFCKITRDLGTIFRISALPIMILLMPTLKYIEAGISWWDTETLSVAMSMWSFGLFIISVALNDLRDQKNGEVEKLNSELLKPNDDSLANKDKS